MHMLKRLLELEMVENDFNLHNNSAPFLSPHASYIELPAFQCQPLGLRMLS